MIVHSLHVKDFCGLEDFTIEPMEKGITLIEGPNEAGKSCLARALYIVLDEPDGSRKKEILGLQPAKKDVGPVIEADIETGPYRFTIRKQYVKDCGTVLNILKPTPMTLRSRDAHNKVQEILNETLDIALWKALNIIQGEDSKEIPTNSSLSIALNKASGTLPMGERELDLFDLVEAEKEKYLSSKGPTKEFKNVKQEKERLEKKVEEISREFEIAEKNVGEYARIAQEIQGLLPKKANLENERLERKQGLDYGTGLLSIVTLEEEKEKRKKSEYEAILKDFDARKELLKELESATSDVKKLKDNGDFENDIVSSQTDLINAKELLKDTELKVDESRKRKDSCQKNKDYFNSCLWLEQLKERKTRIDASRQEAASHTLLLKTNLVDDEILKDILKANNKLEAASYQLNESSPIIYINPDNDIDVIVNGEPISLESHKTLEKVIHDELNLILPNVVGIKIMSGSSPDKLKKKRQEAQEFLKTLLDKYGVNGEDAIKANQEWHHAQSIIDRCKTDEAQDLRDLTYDELDQKIYETDSKVQKYEGEYESGLAKPSDAGEASKLLLDSTTQLESAENDLVDVKRIVEERSKKFDILTKKYLKIKTDISIAENTVSMLNNRIASLRELSTDETLISDLNEKRGQLRIQVDTLKQKRLEFAKYDIDLLRKGYNNSEKALASFDDQLNKYKQKLSELKIRIEIQEEQGVFEKMNQAKSELEQIKKEYEAVNRSANAASMLFEIMEEAKIQTQTAYANPLKKRIENLGKFLFGDSFQVELNEELNIVSRTLNGMTLPYKALSTGAREQIGLITKLACAMTVSDNGGVPILIDDALGHTDSSRINGMATIIGIAGDDCQIILLTCLPSRYIGIGNMKTISII
jgi:hypothetical protein